MLKVSVFHEQEYELLPESIAAVNGCIHLLGGHTGFALGKSLSYITAYPLYVAISERSDSSVRFFCADTGERKRSALQSLKYKREDRWANNIKAVIASFINRKVSIPGLNITVLCEIPSTSMGITVSMVLAAAFVLRSRYAPSMRDSVFIPLVQTVCASLLDGNTSLADILCALYGKKDTFLQTDYASGSYQLIPSPLVEYALMVTDAKIPGASVVNELHVRMITCSDIFDHMRVSLHYNDLSSCPMDEVDDFLSTYPEATRRHILCIVQEIARVGNACAMLKKGDVASFFREVNHSHDALRDLYEISFPEIDWLAKRMQETGTQAAARIIGSGNGGCIYGIIEKGRLEEYRTKLDEYERIFGFHPVVYTVESAGKAKIYNGEDIHEHIIDK